MEPGIEYFNSKKILITGGGGYLGSKLAEALNQSSGRIALMDISFNSLSEKLIEQNENGDKYQTDITKKSDLEAAIHKIQPDYIFHFCALLNRERSFVNYNELYNVNVQGTLNLLESLRSINYKGFYFSSTSEVYGRKNSCTFHEGQIQLSASPYSLGIRGFLEALAEAVGGSRQDNGGGDGIRTHDRGLPPITV